MRKRIEIGDCFIPMPDDDRDDTNVFAEAVDEFNDGEECWCGLSSWWCGTDCDHCLLCCNYWSEDQDITEESKQHMFARWAANKGYLITRKGYEQYSSPNLSQEVLTLC